MSKPIRVAILEDYLITLEGYKSCLSRVPNIEIVATASYGDELLPLLEKNSVDVLILDVMVPTSKDNSNPYPMYQVMKKVIQSHPSLYMLVISMYSERTLIESIIESGATGYLLKSDTKSMSELGSIILSIAAGDVYFNKEIREQLLKRNRQHGDIDLTPRQLEAMSVCVAHSNLSNLQLAEKLGVAHSTFRNLLSGSYIRLGVSNRSAAIAKVRDLGLIAPYPNELHSIIK